MPVASMGTLYVHATIIPVNAGREIILDGALLIRDSFIEAVGKTSELQNRLKEEMHSIKIVDCSDRIIIPGLINTHAHLAQSILRGLAEDLPLHSWLCDAIWPLEASYQGDDGYTAAMLTIAEMLKSGTTCLLEAMCTHGSGIENVVRAVGETGIRACLGKLVKSAETNPEVGMTDARDKDVSSMSVSSAIAAHEAFNGSFNDRLHIWMACGTPRGSPISAHSAIGIAAKERDMGITMHCAEAPKDLEIFRGQYSCSPMQFCRDAQIAGPKTVLAHMVHPDPTAGDFEIMRETGTTVSHNPSSNCKLGSGISPIPDMLAAGVNVALGTDGAPCNNTYDMFSEMHLAAILHSGVRESAGIITAYQMLECATINGARALGLEKDIGSLEVGKKADFVVVAPGLNATPWDCQESANGGIDPVTVIVHSCTGADVETVVVDGRVLVQNGKLVIVDEQDVVRRAKLAVAGIRKRSKVGARNHMKLTYR